MRLGVVKVGFLPGCFFVAVHAILSQLAFVPVIFGMTAKTVLGRITILLTLSVASAAGHT